MDDNYLSDYNNMEDISISAISPETKSLLSALLNPVKLFVTPPENHPRYWLGLFTLICMPAELHPAVKASPDPTGYVLSYWLKQSPETAKIGQLLKYLEQIDRYDIVDDIKILLAADVDSYRKQKNAIIAVSNRSIIPAGPSEPSQESSADAPILTVDDAKLSELGFDSHQLYDAFVLFADEDIKFAIELVSKMEEYGLKLCVKHRDLLGGSFEHTAIITLISERCNRLIVIISPDFFQSSANTFFVNFAQAIGIQQRQRKIVPCLYKPCVVPPQLSFYTILSYERAWMFGNFWEKLNESLKAPTQQMFRNQTVKVREIENDNTQIPPPATHDTNNLVENKKKKNWQIRDLLTFFKKNKKSAKVKLKR